ncbi:MAG: protein kinase [Myxococcales bacterium]|nr:protein kinase [Myxococcales bacterium]MCB9577441.1 protein kinase [Polyangiaceae bacterium]
MTHPQVGDVIDRRYLLVREIDRGGVGAVYEAEHRITQRSVALKLLSEHHRTSPESRARLLREARALTLARHRNVVAALDAGELDDGQPYLVMELMEGRTLSGLLTARRKLGVAETVSVGIQLCDAVSQAHARGVIHRDVKPQNVFVARDEVGEEVIKLFDFGLARLSGESENIPDKKLTDHGKVMGTAEYMAPEQLLAKDVDHRADVYSIGSTLYECLAGVVPFEGTFGEVLLKVSTEELPPLAVRVPDAPVDLCRAIEKALAKDPAGRWQDVHDLSRALTAGTDSPFAKESLLGIRTSARPKQAAEPTRQRRRYARAPYVTPVRIVEESGRTVDGRSEDISEGGLLVLTEEPCTMNARVEVRFALPTTGRIATATATTRWARIVRGTGAAGLEFEALADPIRQAIQAYVTMMGGIL